MESLFPTFDIECYTAVIRNNDAGVDTPLFVADYGPDSPSFYETMLRYKKISLDVVPKRSGMFVFIVTSDMVVAELNVQSLERALHETSAINMFRELSREGTPEFSVTYDVGVEDHERFTVARERMGGSWLFLVAASDVVELTINSEGIIVDRGNVPRSKYFP